MTGYFIDTTRQFEKKQVLLQSKNNQYYCEDDHPIQEIMMMTFICKQYKKEYMGPLLTT